MKTTSLLIKFNQPCICPACQNLGKVNSTSQNDLRSNKLIGTETRHFLRALSCLLTDRCFSMTSVNSSSSRTIVCRLTTQSLQVEDVDSELNRVSLVTSLMVFASAFFAVIANGLVVVAVWKTTSLRFPSVILLCCLAVTDFLTGLVNQPSFVVFNIARIQGNYNLYCNASSVWSLVNAFLSNLSFLVITCASVDRYLALHLHLRYLEVVSTRRVYLLITICCVFCCVVLLLQLLGKEGAAFAVEATAQGTSLLINIVSYRETFRIIGQHERKIKSEEKISCRIHGKTLKHFKRSKKLSHTMVYVGALFLLCYAPYSAVLIAMAVPLSNSNMISKQLRVASNVTAMLILLNASANPVFYCYRLAEIRKAVFKLLRRLDSKFCSHLSINHC